MLKRKRGAELAVIEHGTMIGLTFDEGRGLLQCRGKFPFFELVDEVFALLVV